MYKLSHALSLDNNTLLWYAILGVTDLFVHQKISKYTYEDMAETHLQSEVRRLNPESDGILKNKTTEVED
jgi:hypothetical protein